MKSVFVGTKRYDDATKKVADAIAAYSTCLDDLAISLNLRLLEKSERIEGKTDNLSKQLDQLLTSSDLNFQSLSTQTQETSVSIESLVEASVGKYSHCPILFKSVDLRVEKEKREEEKLFNDWLSPSIKDVEKEKKKYLRVQRATSPTWVFDLPEVNHWLNAKSTNQAMALWLSGTTGFGKSVVAAYVTEEISVRYPSSSITYFFCKDSHNLRETHLLMRTFVCQATSRFPAIRRAIRKIYEQEGNLIDSCEDVSDIEEFFQKIVAQTIEHVLKATDSIFFILDGLNECPLAYRKGMVAFVTCLQKMTGIRILITSQPTPDIVVAFTSCSRVELRKHYNQKNIESYINQELANDHVLLSRFKDIGVDPLKFLQQKHEGMFLWVSTVLKYLKDVDSDDEFNTLLFEVPDTVNGLYRKCLERIHRDISRKEKWWVNSIFCWVVAAQRDLLLQELEVALSLTRQLDHHLAQRPKVWDIERTLSKCGAFLRTSYLDDQISVSLVHESFGVFLTNKEECIPDFLIEKTVANSIIARVCMSYLSTEMVLQPDVLYAPNDLPRQQDRCHPLFRYATKYWISHLTRSKVFEDVGDELLKATSAFLSKANFHTWLRSMLAYWDDILPWFPGVFVTLTLWMEEMDVELYYASGYDESQPTGSDATVEMKRTDLTVNPLYIDDWIRRLIAEVWLSTNPRYRMAAKRAVDLLKQFKFLDEICAIFASPDHISIESDKVGQIMKWAAVGGLKKTATEYTNIAHALVWDDPDVNSIRAAIHNYSLSLELFDEVDAEVHVLLYLSDAHYKMCTMTGLKHELDESIALARRSLSLGGEDNIGSHCARVLVFYLQERFQRTGSLQDLDEVIGIARKALHLLSDEHPDRLPLLDCLANSLSAKSQCTGSLIDLQIAIEAARTEAAVAERGSPGNVIYVYNLAEGLGRRFEQTGLMNDLNESIKLLKMAVASLPPNHPKLRKWANNAVVALLRRHEKTGLLSDLNDAIDLGRKSTQSLPKEDANFPGFVHNLALALYRKHKVTMSIDELAESLELAKMALNLDQPNSSSVEDIKNLISIGLLARFECTGSRTDLNESINEGKELIMSTSRSHPNVALFMNNLATGLMKRYECSGSLDDLNESIEMWKYSILYSSTDDLTAAARGGNLALAVLKKFERTELMEYIIESIGILREAIDLIHGERSPLTYSIWRTLGTALILLSECTGSSNDLDEGIEILKHLINVVPFEDEFFPMTAAALTMGALKKHQLSDSWEDIDDTVILARKAMKSVQVSGRKYYSSSIAIILAITLIMRYFAKESVEDLHESIIQAKAAVASAFPGSGEYCRGLSILASALVERYEHLDSIEDLHEALRLGHVLLNADPPPSPSLFIEAASLIMFGFQAQFDGTENIEDVKKLIDIGRRVINTVPTHHPVMDTYVNNLWDNISSWHEFAKTGENLNDFVTVFTTLADLHPETQRYHYIAGSLLWWLEDYDRAISSFEQGLRKAPPNSGVVDPEQLHHPATCDICAMPVKGYLYQCKSCRDYDVCEGCLGKVYETHETSHQFLSIPRKSHFY